MKQLIPITMAFLLAACGGSDSDDTSAQLGNQIDKIERQSESLGQSIASNLQRLEQESTVDVGPSSGVVDQISDDYQQQLANHTTLLKECDALRLRIEREIADTSEFDYNALEELKALNLQQADTCLAIPQLQPDLDAIAQLLETFSSTLLALEQQVADAKALLASLTDDAENIQLIPGPMGSPGPQGDTGPVGAQGPQGDTGMEGAHFTRAEVDGMYSDFMASEAGKRDNGNLESNDRELKEIEKRLETMISLLVSIRSEGTAP